MIRRDTRWEIFYGDISIEEFVDKKVPKPVFANEVNKDVKDAFGVVEKLLLHSYYEYLFLDVAVTKALHIMEMALCIRYKELNNGEEWDLKKNPLYELTNWFGKNSLFEVKDPRLLDYIRRIRNHMTHPKGHHFAGTAGLPLIHTIVDLINGLYDDVEVRKVRWESTTDWGTKLEAFLEKGGKLICLGSVFYVYDMGPLKMENRLNPALCYFSLLPLFDLSGKKSKAPLVFECPMEGLAIEGNKIDFSLGSDVVFLTNDLSAEEINQIETFKSKWNSDVEYGMYTSMQILDAKNAISDAIRKKMNSLYQGS